MRVGVCLSSGPKVGLVLALATTCFVGVRGLWALMGWAQKKALTRVLGRLDFSIIAKASVRVNESDMHNVVNIRKITYDCSGYRCFFLWAVLGLRRGYVGSVVNLPSWAMFLPF
jgi:hypothetical protein